jgi:hypothetical protein
MCKFRISKKKLKMPFSVQLFSDFIRQSIELKVFKLKVSPLHPNMAVGGDVQVKLKLKQ